MSSAPDAVAAAVPPSVPPIEASVSSLPTAESPLPAVEERYYTRYMTDPSATEETHCVMLHSNRICVVCLAPDHPAVRPDSTLEVASVDFKVSDTVDRSENCVRGKGKKGGQGVDERSILCRIKCRDKEAGDGGDRVFQVRSCVRGKLVEVNVRLASDPGLVARRPLSDGYVAVVLLKIPDGVNEMKSRMLTEEEYRRRKKEASESSHRTEEC